MSSRSKAFAAGRDALQPEENEVSRKGHQFCICYTLQLIETTYVILQLFLQRVLLVVSGPLGSSFSAESHFQELGLRDNLATNDVLQGEPLPVASQLGNRRKTLFELSLPTNKG